MSCEPRLWEQRRSADVDVWLSAPDAVLHTGAVAPSRLPTLACPWQNCEKPWEPPSSPKSFCERAGIVVSQAEVDMPRKDRSVFSHRLAPVFQQRSALYLRIPRVWPESRGSDRLAPRSEVLQHKVRRDSGV